jgi:hypothetical protein
MLTSTLSTQLQHITTISMIDMAVMEANIRSRSWQPYQPCIRCQGAQEAPIPHKGPPGCAKRLATQKSTGITGELPGAWWIVAWHSFNYQDLPSTKHYQGQIRSPKLTVRSCHDRCQFPPFYAERNWARVKTKPIRSQKEHAHEEHHSESFWTAVS